MVNVLIKIILTDLKFMNFFTALKYTPLKNEN